MVADEQTLADMLRDQLGLIGCKVGCDQAVCGACTVLVERHTGSGLLLLCMHG